MSNPLSDRLRQIGKDCYDTADAIDSLCAELAGAKHLAVRLAEIAERDGLVYAERIMVEATLKARDDDEHARERA